MTPQLIPLARAVLCEECTRVSESTGATCAGCGSKAIVNLESLLNRELRPADATRSAEETQA